MMKRSPNIVEESQFISTIVRYVMGGSGIGVLNRLHIPKDAQSHCAVVDIYPAVRSYIYLLYRRKFSCPAAVDFLHFIIEKISK